MILLCSGTTKAFLRRNELVYVNAMFDNVMKKKNLLTKHYILPTLMLFHSISDNIEQRYYKQLHLLVEGIKRFSKTFDLQLEACEKLMNFLRSLKWESAAYDIMLI